MARAKTSPRSMQPNDAGKLFDGEAFGCCFFWGFLPEVSGFDNTTATLTGSRETVRRLLVAEIILLPGGNLRVACFKAMGAAYALLQNG